jgi:two-component system cell cycle response regulator
MADEQIHVLVVEDNPGDARLVHEMLREDGAADFALTHVASVREALEALTAEVQVIDAVLLDLTLPDESGLDTLRRVVAAGSRAVIVVMTGIGDEQLGLLAMQAGAQDYLVKGQVDGRMLRRAVRYAIERQDVRLRLEDLSLKDDLTGLHNRRAFLDLAGQQLRLARRNHTPGALLFLDMDQLKFVNDMFGHSEGNRALVEAANILRDSFRQSDIVSRLGGDEFAAFAITSPEWDVQSIRQRITAALQRVNAKPDRDYLLGFSMGILSCDPSESASVEDLLERADALMYEDKRRGTGLYFSDSV